MFIVGLCFYLYINILFFSHDNWREFKTDEYLPAKNDRIFVDIFETKIGIILFS